MRRRDWLLSVIGWDGCLPVLVAFSPLFLPLVLPNRDLAEVTAVFLMPMAAALIRTQHGYRQIEKRVGRVSLGRQFLLGCAIVVLLVFEIGAAAAASSARKTPPSGWLLAAVSYLTYLVLIVRALRPQRLADA
jgi:hypothetical protein